MDEDILAELDRQLTEVNLDKYWVKKVGGYELWLSVIDYLQSNKVKKAIEGEFGLEEAKRVTLSASIVGVNGSDFRALRRAGKTIRVKSKGGKDELVDLSEYIYRKIANWDVDFVDVVFDAYSDIMESHRKDLVKELVFENSKTDEEELEILEERAASIRMKLGKPPLVEAVKLSDVPSNEPEMSGEEAPAPEEALEDEEEPLFPDPPPRKPEKQGEEDFDPFSAVSSPSPVQAAAAPVPVPAPPEASANPTTPSAIERALLARRGSSPMRPDVAPVSVHVGQPSVPEEVIEKSSARLVVDRPTVDPHVAQQNRNPRFRRQGA